MSRRTPAKRKTMRKAPKTALSQQLEKEFSDLPARLATQLSKEAASLRQTESKLKSSIAKLNAQIKKSTSKAKQKTMVKTLAILTKQLQESGKQLIVISQKHAKFSAIRKQLSELNKDWAKKLKSAKAHAVVKAKKKTATRTTKKTMAGYTMNPSQPARTEPQHDMSNDMMQRDVTNETVS